MRRQRKCLRRIGAWALAAAMILGVAPSAAPKTAEAAETTVTGVNYAPSGTATVSDKETDYWGADKAIDGIVNRDAKKPDQSRWSTNQNVEAPCLTVDLGIERTFNRFIIEWERTNVTGFKIETSDTGNDNGWTEVYSKPDNTYVNSASEVELQDPASARYVRLTITDYTGNAEPDDEINWKSISVYEFKIIADVDVVGENILENLSLSADASASGSEDNNSFGPARAADGSSTTRWASAVRAANEANPHWLQLRWDTAQTIQTIRIHWERCNPISYSIQKSDDGSIWEDVKTFRSKPTDYRQTIELDKPVTTQYLRINITSFDPNGASESGSSVQWDTVSVYEFETYSYAGILETAEELTAEDIADNLTVPSEIGTDDNFSLPAVPEGYEISFIGADYEHILDRDLKVWRPLADKDITVNFQVQEADNPDSAVDSKEYTITVKGQYTTEDGDNDKPAVIPELAEWKGAQDGEFSVENGTRILLHPDVTNELTYMAEEFKADYEDIMGGTIEIVTGTEPQAGDFYFTDSDGRKGLKEEGYYMDIDDYITIEAEEVDGAYWSTRTILQILTQTNGTIPKGETRDYPKYEVRGFMIDVARRPFSWDIVDEIAKTMSWYKMNDLQLHLNDNYIPLENYTNRGDDPMTAYEGFRMESDVKAGGNNGLNQTDLTSDDMYYTKDDMRDFIQNYRKLGIDIIPEFDTPAHSLSFTKVRPDLRLGTSGRENDHLNLTTTDAYDASLEFVKSLWDEYLDGDDPVFDQDTIINVGTDEYGAYNEQFRQYTDDLITYIQGKGRTVRLWGSLTTKSGNTEVTSEGVQMNIWNDGWANPQQMYEEGYDLIDMNDGTLYIVPAAGYYYDYLNSSHLYNNYDPATRMGVPVGSEQVLGGAYALWNDMVDNSANGLTETEIYDRFNAAAPYYASSLWGEGADRNYNETSQLSSEIGEAPRTNAYDRVESQTDTIVSYDFESDYTDASGNSYNAEEGVNAEITDGALVLSGGESYVDTPLDRIGVGQTLSFDIELTSPAKPGQILFESDAEYGTYDIRIMEDGTLGFTRECYDYSFGYKLPVNEKISLKIETREGTTTLYVDNMSFPATGSFTYEGDLKASDISRSSLSIPLGRIGSATNAVNAVIDNVNVVTGEAMEYTYVDRGDITPSATSENASDGQIANAFDDNVSTIWHSNYTPEQENPPFTITMELASRQDINGFYYLPRQTGDNGYITQYTLYYYDENNTKQPLITNGTWSQDSSEKIVYFTPVNTNKLELVVEAGKANFGSAAEFKILSGSEDMSKTTIYACAYTDGGGTAVTDLEQARIEPGTEVTFTARPDTGATFLGWYDSITGAQVSTEEVYKTAVNDTTILIAEFESVTTHKVTIGDDVQYVKDGDLAVKPTDPTKAGHYFLGWFEEDSDTAFDFDQPITEDVTLTARFQAYTVTATADSGVTVSEMDDQGRVTVTASQREGYNFTGWMVNGTKVSAGLEYTFVPEADTTVEPVYEEIVPGVTYYKVTIGGQTIPVKENDLVNRPTDPVKPGYKFIGWYVGDKEYDFSQPVTSDLVIEARFEKIATPVGPGNPGDQNPDGSKTDKDEDKAVETGDVSNFAPWALFLVISAGAVVVLAKRKTNK